MKLDSVGRGRSTAVSEVRISRMARIQDKSMVYLTPSVGEGVR